ncbi:S-layer family protein [Natranaerovirga hydrolytica]|uniref:S-layer family protein n=1 Tax=Natranaerovirga hydrolytica TaxID=680378 RepID=A0A4R1MPT9_9FIRM|nr:S-layer homology domain-containing protein [Natranaerovirga hydrolytica]TCK93344.1 S-layer family protein [Natranaerovirga hydrolytica]
MRKKVLVGALALALTSTVTSTIISEPMSQYIMMSTYAQEVDYEGRERGQAIIDNINFRDVSNDHWAKEAITRLGAIDIVKGDGRNYRPQGAVTNEEALAFVLRILGMEEAAQVASLELEDDFVDDEHILDLWSKGYLQVAMELGLITNDDFLDGLEPDQDNLPEDFFRRKSPATREQVAQWLVEGINAIEPNAIEPIYVQNHVRNYNDWQSIDNDKIPFVEAVIANNIMVGDNVSFRPKAHLTRAEMAMIIRNVDDVLYDVLNLENKHGTVERIEIEGQVSSQMEGNKKIYVRTQEGNVEVINYQQIRNNNNITYDAPVFYQGNIRGLNSLEQGDNIEYLVSSEDHTIMYVHKKGETDEEEVTGILEPLDQLEDGLITIQTSNGAKVTYFLSERLYINDTIRIDLDFINKDNAPVGQEVTLTTLNNLVTYVDYAEMSSPSEVRGTVNRIAPSFGYVVITDWNTGEDIEINYYRDHLDVQKQMHYDNVSEGYISGAFTFNPLSTTIEAIEPGDIVHIRLDDNGYATEISAATNYVVKYGRINNINFNSTNDYNFTIESEDGQMAYYEVNDSIVVRKGNANIFPYEIQSGDWVKLLVNQGVIEPGNMIESVKEISVDSYRNNVTKIFRGQLDNNGFNRSQRSISLLNSEELGLIGWDNYRENRSLDIKDRDLEVYYVGQRITLEEALYRYTGPNYNVYVAMEDLPGRDEVCRISIYDSRDSVLDHDYVVNTDGGQSFNLLNEDGSINTDQGTIIVRNGRLVETSNIMAPDYAQVVLSGASRAAVVNISQPPGNDMLTISRGRINGIDDNRSFEVSSQGMLNGMDWIFSPIERTYNMNYETVIIDEDGTHIPFNQFRGYDEDSQIDEVYTIISEGLNAKYVVKNPYSTEGVTGNIYEVNEDHLMINNVRVYDENNNTWEDLSYRSSYAQIDIEDNSIILKNNRVISVDELVRGDSIRVLTTENLIDQLREDDERDVPGYIILVE